MIHKLNPSHLKKLLNNNCDIKLFDNGLSEEGEPIVFLFLENQKCRFVEKSKIIVDSDKKKVELIGKVLLLGDIVPSLKRLTRRRSTYRWI